MSAAAQALCAERVAAGDPDRFAAVMASPAALRAPLFALYAANLEIARAPWASGEPIVAEMRLQWWIDAFSAQAGKSVEIPHEIGAALSGFPAAVLQALVAAAEARRADCWSDPFADAGELRAYLAATSGRVYAAAGVLLGGAETTALADFGAAAGFAQWLIALPELRARGRLDLPLPEAELAALAGAELARLEAASAALARAPRPLRIAALPGWDARGVLRRAAGAPEKIVGGRLRGSEFSRRFGLLRATLRL